MPRRILFVLSCLAVLAASCSSSDGISAEDIPTTQAKETDPTTTTTTRPVAVEEEPESAYIDAFAGALVQAGGQSLKPVLTAEQASCFAPVWVGLATPEGLALAGISSQNLANPAFDLRYAGLDAGQATEAVDALGACGVDSQALVVAAFTADMDEQTAACASANLDPAKVKELLAAAFTRDIELEQTYLELAGGAMAACQGS